MCLEVLTLRIQSDPRHLVGCNDPFYTTLDTYQGLI